MRTNLSDDQLVATAQKLCGYKTKRETVTAALELLIQRKKLEGIEKGFGTVDFSDDFLKEMGRRMSTSKRLAALRSSPAQKSPKPKKARG